MSERGQCHLDMMVKGAAQKEASIHRVPGHAAQRPQQGCLSSSRLPMRLTSPSNTCTSASDANEAPHPAGASCCSVDACDRVRPFIERCLREPPAGWTGAGGSAGWVAHLETLNLCALAAPRGTESTASCFCSCAPRALLVPVSVQLVGTYSNSPAPQHPSAQACQLTGPHTARVLGAAERTSNAAYKQSARRIPARHRQRWIRHHRLLGGSAARCAQDPARAHR